MMSKVILIVDCGSSKTTAIESMVDEYCAYETLPFFTVTSSTLDRFAGVIISGAPILITEENMVPFIQQAQWIKTMEIPLLGICFGHQLIGLIYDAFPDRIKDCRSWNEVESFIDCPILHRLPSIFEMQEDHCECISIPSEFNLVANSDECVNEVMQHQSKPIFGVQFHPEISGNYGHILVENFINLC
ncbi:MAG: glutamine amidotransferase-related protein [Flavobacteriales bacterium]|jgi:GMP synthase (glutamine-hydrolysing)